MKPLNKKYHSKRAEWVKETVKACEKHGDLVEYETNGMDFYIKVTCTHKEILDRG